MEPYFSDRFIAIQAFWQKVDRSGDGCWLWQRATTPEGYGMAYFMGRTTGAHRVAYELANGPVPEGLQVDHLCRNPSCVNPDHLEAVTPRENVRRSRRHPKTNGILVR